MTQPTHRGTVLVIKAPSREIESVRGTVPILLHHELYEHPAARVIRMETGICDQPDRPLKFESFINVGDDQQRADYAALAEQDELLLLYDVVHGGSEASRLFGTFSRNAHEWDLPTSTP